MAKQTKSIVIYFVLIVTGLCFLFWGLIHGRSFLLPLTVAILFPMIILPLGRWFERQGIKRG